jgi:hypothetical protein
MRPWACAQLPQLWLRSLGAQWVARALCRRLAHSSCEQALRVLAQCACLRAPPRSLRMKGRRRAAAQLDEHRVLLRARHARAARAFHGMAQQVAATRKRSTTPVGLEPARGGPVGLAGRRLYRSAKVSDGGGVTWRRAVAIHGAAACESASRAKAYSLHAFVDSLWRKLVDKVFA